MKDKKFVALSSFFFILFFAAVAAVTLQKPTSQVLRAKNTNPSPLKSFIIVFPQIGVISDDSLAKSPKEIKVSVFIRDEGGSVLSGRSVKLSTTPSVSIKPQDTVNTDNLGMAQFFISARETTTVKLTATDLASNTTLSNSPTVEFTQ